MKDARPSIPGIELGELRHSAGRLTTYDAIDRSTRQPVVVSGIAPGDDDYLELVLAHQRALQNVVSANIQQVLDTGIDASGQCYVVAESVEGELLETLEGQTAIERLPAIADAVRVLHDQGLAHGALAPENIAIRPDGTLVLLNAGLAGYVDSSASIFQPDEQALRPRPVVADDIFALGALGWWLQSGRTPDKPGSLGAPVHVEAALRRALDLDADNRQWTIQEFLYELEHTVDENRSFIPSDQMASQLPPAGLGPRRLPILAGALGLVALLFAAFTVFRPSDPDINTEVLGVTTVPTTDAAADKAVTTPTTVAASIVESSGETETTADAAGETPTAPPTTRRQTAPSTTAAPRVTTTSPPATTTPSKKQTIPTLSTTPSSNPLTTSTTKPTTTTTKPTTTTTRPTTTTTRPTTTAAPTTAVPTTAVPTTATPTTVTPTTKAPVTTVKPPVTTATTAGSGDVSTQNPVLPDTPVTGNAVAADG